MNLVDFDPRHIREMRLQEAQVWALSVIPPVYTEALNRLGPAVTAMDGETILASAGIVGSGFGSGTLWGFVSQDAGKHMVSIIKVLNRLLVFVQLRRIEASTETDFKQGCRLLELVKFKNEGVMESYGADGRDHFRYARIFR
jgi:hypothetical protein